MNLLQILTLIKKRVEKNSYLPGFDRESEALTVYEKLKEGYQILLESTPESMLFEEYVQKESSDLLDEALEIVNAETPVVAEPQYTPVEISVGQIFRLFLPANTISPLMTWQMR